VKHYDRGYFDKWYRDPRHRVGGGATLRRKVAMVVGVAEYLLQRPLRSVLDVGCGEGRWRQVLRRLRPAAVYEGVDASEYVVRRYGRRRNLRLGAFGTLHTLDLPGGYDLVVCSDVLHYVPGRDLGPGLRTLRALLAGVAFLETYTRHDAITGDLVGFHGRPAATYFRAFAEAGLVPCGLQCYVPDDLEEDLTALERLHG